MVVNAQYNAGPLWFCVRYLSLLGHHGKDCHQGMQNLWFTELQLLALGQHKLQEQEEPLTMSFSKQQAMLPMVREKSILF